jgi:hypothetical protein
MVLATAERASRSTFHIDKHCASCGAIENDVISSFYAPYLNKFGLIPTLLCPFTKLTLI